MKRKKAKVLAKYPLEYITNVKACWARMRTVSFTGYCSYHHDKSCDLRELCTLVNNGAPKKGLEWDLLTMSIIIAAMVIGIISILIIKS